MMENTQGRKEDQKRWRDGRRGDEKNPTCPSSWCP